MSTTPADPAIALSKARAILDTIQTLANAEAIDELASGTLTAAIAAALEQLDAVEAAIAEKV